DAENEVPVGDARIGLHDAIAERVVGARALDVADRLILGAADRKRALSARPRSERAAALLVVVRALGVRQLVEAPVQAIQEQELAAIRLERLQELPELEGRVARGREAGLRLVAVRLEQEQNA